MNESTCFALTALIYIAWLAFLAWLIKYFNSALPLFLLIASPRVKYLNDKENEESVRNE